MIIKSFELNKINNYKCNLFLLYGENEGLKKDIKELIKKSVNGHNTNIEVLSLYEKDIIDNEESFYNTIYSGSLFGNKKIINIINSLLFRIYNGYDADTFLFFNYQLESVHPDGVIFYDEYFLGGFFIHFLDTHRQLEQKPDSGCLKIKEIKCSSGFRMTINSRIIVVHCPCCLQSGSSPLRNCMKILNFSRGNP